VDEYLSDKEQVERLRNWWRENGLFLIGGLALGGLGIFGWKQYQSAQLHKSEQAQALYASAKQAAEGNELEQAKTLLAQLRAEYPNNVYTQQAALAVASASIVIEPDTATENLRIVMDSSTDAELAMIARLRLARVLAYREQYDDALALLAVESPGEFAGRIDEIKGDIYVSMGRLDDARAAYLAAMVAPGAEVLDRSYLQMKLGDLPSLAAPAAAAPAADSVPPAATGDAAAPAATTEPGEGA
jgi:predicted negative regulator of RcsB-dependent stress response